MGKLGMPAYLLIGRRERKEEGTNEGRGKTEIGLGLVGKSLVLDILTLCPGQSAFCVLLLLFRLGLGGQVQRLLTASAAAAAAAAVAVARQGRGRSVAIVIVGGGHSDKKQIWFLVTFASKLSVLKKNT